MAVGLRYLAYLGVVALLVWGLWLGRDNLHLAQERSDLQADLQASQQRTLQLEVRLAEELGRQEQISQRILETREQLQQHHMAQRVQVLKRQVPLPEGLRLAMAALHECLRMDGYDGLRFFSANGIEDRCMQQVELVDSQSYAANSTWYVADRMTLHLDRSSNSLSLRFFSGVVLNSEGRREIDEEGYELLLPEVDGRYWEKRLPYLVQAEGEYPAVEEELAKRIPKMDLAMRATWIERVNRLLALAQNPLRYSLQGLRDLQGGEFREALLLGTGASGTLAMSAEAERLLVWVDKQAGLVELRMFDGILRKEGGTTNINSAGYAIQLIGVTPKQASDILMGMVKKK